MMKSLILIFSMSLLFSCSKNVEKKTKANFKVTFAASDLATGLDDGRGDGGVFIYGQTTNGSKAFSRFFGEQEMEREIDNGEWKFYAIAWEGGSYGPFTGKVRCAKSGTFDLDGSDETVEMTISNDNCEDNVFSSGQMNEVGGNKQFARVDIETCNDINSVTSGNTDCEYDIENDIEDNNKGYASSYKVIFQSYDKNNNSMNPVGPEIESEVCAAVSADTAGGLANIDGETFHALSLLNLPSGNNSSSIFGFKLRAYYGTTDCDETPSTKGFKDILLQKGALGNSGKYKSFPKIVDGTKTIKIYTKVSESNVCSGARMDDNNSDPTPYAGGNGTAGLPFLICNPAQLNAIREIDDDKNFKILKNLNMLDVYNDDSPLNVGGLACVKNEGGTFVPIGGWVTSCGGSHISPDPFTTNFDGNNKVITGLRFHDMEMDYVGMFRRLGTGAIVKNIILENSQLMGYMFVGSLAGDVYNSVVKNIIVKDSFVDSKNGRVGGIVGKIALSANIENLSFSGKVYGGEQYAGGIAGYFWNVTAKKLKFSGKVENYSGLGSTGGIVGKMHRTTGSSILSEASSEGVIVNYGGSGTGGIVGTSLGISAIRDVYSAAVINNPRSYYDNSTAVNLGGIIGDPDPSVVLARTIFRGSISHNCTHADPSMCNIGNLAGKSIGSLTLSYAINSLGETSLGGENGAAKTEASLRVAGVDASMGDTVESWPYWSMVNGDFPRLREEDHECEEIENRATVATQISYGRGTQSNPVKVCNRDQVIDIATKSDKHYSLAQDINLGSHTPIPNFSGSINGNGNIIHNMQVLSTIANNGFIGDLKTTGRINNIEFVNAYLNPVVLNDTFIGVVAAKNSGVIEDVKVTASKLEHIAGSSVEGTGFIAGKNDMSGVIRKSFVAGEIKGKTVTGGIVGHNWGLIELSKSDMTFVASIANYSRIGGVVGFNQSSGTIKQSYFSGNFNLEPFNSSNAKLGGFAGQNAGIIKNSYVKEGVSISTGSNQSVGGFVGYTTSGTIENSYTMAYVNYDGDENSAPETYGGFVGDNSGGTITDSYNMLNAFKTIGYSNENVACSEVEIEGNEFTILNFEAIYATTYVTGQSVILSSDEGMEINQISGASATLAVGADAAIELANGCNEENYDSVNLVAFGTSQIQTVDDPNQMYDIGTFCFEPSPSDNFVCSDGWDIIDENNGFGADRLNTMRWAEMTGSQLTNAQEDEVPIWEIGHEGFPELVLMKSMDR